MNEIQRYRFGYGLISEFGLPQGDTPSPIIAPEIVPVILLPNGEERRALYGERLAACTQSIAAVVGKFSSMRIRNPPASNMLLIIEAAILISNTATVDDYVFSTGAATTDLAQLPTAPGRSYRDLRLSGTPTGIVTFDNQSVTLAGANFIKRGRVLGSTEARGPVAILPPGFAYEVQSALTNTQTSVTFEWRERPYPPSEQIS